MKDIYTILGEIGLTVPEEKKSAFDTAVRENYKTVSEHDKKSESKKERRFRRPFMKNYFVLIMGLARMPTSRNTYS